MAHYQIDKKSSANRLQELASVDFSFDMSDEAVEVAA